MQDDILPEMTTVLAKQVIENKMYVRRKGIFFTIYRHVAEMESIEIWIKQQIN